MNGMDMLLGPLFRQLGIKPEEMQQTIALMVNTMLELQASQKRIEAKLDMLMQNGATILPVIENEGDAANE